MPNELDKIWEDQAQFNAQIRPHPTTFEAKSLVTSELVLALTDEAHELLRTTKWKKHRRPRRHEVNLAHTTEEIVDMFKDFITICQAWDISPETLIAGYWAKSAVNRQRYSEEWVRNHIDGPVILLDLDNVLCDYIRGFGDHLLHDIARSSYMADKYFNMLVDRVAERKWIDETLFPGDEQWYRDFKHAYRTGGYKRMLPLMPGACEFVEWCAKRATVILLTARPIDKYPNMLTDTVAWLTGTKMLPHISHIWWGVDKGKVVELEEIQQHVLFAVDDVLAHCNEYNQKSIVSYWLAPNGYVTHNPWIQHVRSFDDIKEFEEGRHGIR